MSDEINKHELPFTKGDSDKIAKHETLLENMQKGIEDLNDSIIQLRQTIEDNKPNVKSFVGTMIAVASVSLALFNVLLNLTIAPLRGDIDEMRASNKHVHERYNEMFSQIDKEFGKKAKDLGETMVDQTNRLAKVETRQLEFDARIKDVTYETDKLWARDDYNRAMYMRFAERISENTSRLDMVAPYPEGGKYKTPPLLDKMKPTPGSTMSKD